MTRYEYYALRNAVIVYAVIGIFGALTIGGILFFTMITVQQFCGDDAWPSGLFLGLLVLYFLSVLWRYSDQQAAERRRLEDEHYS